MSTSDINVQQARDAYGNARYATAKEIYEAGLMADTGLNLGFMRGGVAGTAIAGNKIIRYGDDRHVVLIAPTRTGKNRDIITATLLDDDTSFIIVDTKGQNAAISLRRRREMHKGNAFVLNPFGLHTKAPYNLPQHRYNPLSSIDIQSPIFVAEVSSLAETIIIPEGNDPHWADSARQLITGILIYLILFHPDHASLAEMRAIVSLPFRKKKKREEQAAEDDEDQFELMPDEPEPPFWRRKGILLEEVLERITLCGFEPAKQCVNRFIGNYSDEIQSVLSTAITQTAFLGDTAIIESMSKSDFSFVDLKKRRGSVFIVLPAPQIDAYSRWIRLIITSALNELMSQPIGPAGRVTFLLDEFAAISRGGISQVETAMGLAAGYGIRLFCVLQDLGQLQKIYRESWETFLANAGIVQFLTPNDMTTALYISKRSGTQPHGVALPSYNRGVVVPQGEGDASVSRGSGESYQLVARPLLFPGEVLGFAPDKSIIFMAGMDQVIVVRRQPYTSEDRFRRHIDPDPYHPR